LDLNLSDGPEKELALEERKFLHDISNKLVIVQGMSSILKTKLEKVADQLDPKDLERLGKVIKAGEAMTDMIRARRSILIERSEDPE
jgi:hypothetical protein